jgi:hypothetical protein
LSVAPRDHNLNQRLVVLYSKVERYSDAARCAEILRDVFAEHGFAAESAKFGELAAKYLTMTPGTSGAPVTSDAGTVSLISLEPAAGSQSGFSASSVTEISIEVQPEPVAAPMEIPIEMPAPLPTAAIEVSPAASAAHEITIDANEWESMLVEEPPSAATPAVALETAPAAEISVPVDSFTIDMTPPAVEPQPAPEFSMDVVAAEPPPPIVQAPPPPLPPPVQAAPPPPPPKPVVALAPVAAAPAEETDILGDLVADLEESLGDGGFGAPPEKQKPASPPPPKVVPAAAPAPTMAAAASAAAPAPPAPVAPETVPAGFSSISHELPTEAPKIETNEAASLLSGLFDEFKEDAEAAASEAEDPDTHYNLGIAFKEMGLLDEAIGELQKVCRAVEHGHPFSQAIQAYTWLAQCLVDKGVPQAAVRWYEKALKVDGIGEDSRLAVYYDLACAYEIAGNQRKAYETFMEVYSSNIDYRDVADRIKALKT